MFLSFLYLPKDGKIKNPHLRVLRLNLLASLLNFLLELANLWISTQWMC